MKVSSERPERHSEVVRTGAASGAGVPPSALTPREAGASWPFLGPARACLGLLFRSATFSLPAGLGLPSSLWPATLGLRGHLFLPAQPVLLRPWTHLAREPPTPACPSALPPAPGVTAPSFCSLWPKSLGARRGLFSRPQSKYIPSLLGGNRQIAIFFGPLPANPP